MKQFEHNAGQYQLGRVVELKSLMFGDGTVKYGHIVGLGRNGVGEMCILVKDESMRECLIHPNLLRVLRD